MIRAHAILRTAAGGTVWVALSFVLILAAMALAARTPGPRTPVLPARAGQFAFLARGGPETFPPLRVETLRAVLGRGEVARLLGGEGESPPVAPSPSPQPTGTPPQPEPIPDPGEIASDSDLRIEMEASTSRAERGERITYTITVTNVGEGVAKGLRVLSHIPEHTTYVAGEECGGETVRIEDNDEVPGGKSTCVAFPVGPPPRGGHDFANEIGALNPGQRTVTIFTVAVDPDAPDGTIANHAHVDSQDHPRLDSNQVETRVS